MSNEVIPTIKNEQAEIISARVLSVLIRTEVIYECAVSITSDDSIEQISFTLEFLNKQQLTAPPRHEPKLRVGRLILLLRNIDP